MNGVARDEVVVANERAVSRRHQPGGGEIESWIRLDKADYDILLPLLQGEICRSTDDDRTARCRDLIDTLEHGLAGKPKRGAR